MQALFSVLSFLGKATAVFKLAKIFFALPKLYNFAKKFGPVAGDLIKEGELPSGQESQEFLRSMAVIMRLQIIDFPNIDEEEIAKQLEIMAAEMEPLPRGNPLDGK